MENKETPHIRKNIDGSLEFYRTALHSKMSRVVPGPLVLIFVFLYEYTASIKLAFFAMLLFILSFTFITILSSKRPSITLLPFRIKIRNNNYLWQDLSEIYCTPGPYLIFYFFKNTKVEKIEISDLNEKEMQILLEKLSEHKEIIGCTVAPTTQIGHKIAKRIGLKKLEALRLALLFILFLILNFIINNKVMYKIIGKGD